MLICQTNSDTNLAYIKPLPSFYTDSVFVNTFPALVFTACSVNQSHIMFCFLIVQLNSGGQHTPVFSSPLQGTGHDPSRIVPLPLPTMLPSSHSPQKHVYL